MYFLVLFNDVMLSHVSQTLFVLLGEMSKLLIFPVTVEP